MSDATDLRDLPKLLRDDPAVLRVLGRSSAVLSVPGRRFLVDDSHAFDAWINATVMF